MRRLALGVFLLFAGCSTLRYSAIVPEVTPQTSYKLGRIEQGSIGDAIIQITNAYTVPTFTVVEEFVPPGRSSPIPAGGYWRATYRTKNGYLLTHPDYGENAIEVYSDGRIATGWVNIRTGVHSPTEWPGRARFAPTERVRVEKMSFQAELDYLAELVYSGRSGSTIRLMYREYLSDLARPAFTQDLEYDLSGTNDIAFRSLKIQVIEANNSSIRFRVVDDGDLPWLPDR